MLLKSSVATLLAITLVKYAYAGVVRIDSGSTVSVQKPNVPSVTTAPKSDEPLHALSRDEPASIKVGEGFIDPPTDPTVEITTTVLPLSRDEDASIQIGGGLIDPPSDTVEEVTHSAELDFSPKAYITTIDPAPGTLEELEVVLEQQIEDKHKLSSSELGKHVEKSAKLLLLSSPKVNEKPAEWEESIKESEHNDNITEKVEETTTIKAVVTEPVENKSTDGITKLVPINEFTKSEERRNDNNEKKPQDSNEDSKEKSNEDSKEKSNEDSKQNSKEDSKEKKEIKVSSNDPNQSKNSTDSTAPKSEPNPKNDKEEKNVSSTIAPLEWDESNEVPKPDETTAVATELIADPINDIVSTPVLIETEAEYVLVGTDYDEDFGTFTHIDSDVHLQPIVQSVEFVPSSVDGELIVSYGHF